MTVEGQLGVALEISLCRACQAFWFDHHESPQLTHAAVLKLFQTIGDHPAPAQQLPEALRCPRCRQMLLLTHDIQRTTRFQYWRCDAGDGRFISFVEFLREKDFIRPLSQQQLADLRANVQTVTCSSCGASIDLATSSVCAHCGAAISMIDVMHLGELVARWTKPPDA